MSSGIEMNRPRGRSIAGFAIGFAGVTAAIGAAGCVPGAGLGWALAAMAVVLAGAVALLRFRRPGRPLALGMLCGLLAPALIAGSACIPVPLEYRQPPLPPAKQLPPQPQQTNSLPVPTR